MRCGVSSASGWLLLLLAFMNRAVAASFVLWQPEIQAKRFTFAARSLSYHPKRKNPVSMMSSSNVALEVEQKFSLETGSQIVESKLAELGFTKKGETNMVDWYFDLPAPRWILTPQDHWLRFRETERGSGWQLKRGRQHEGGSTIYEELENDEAVEASISMLPNPDIDAEVPTTYEGHLVPQLPRPTCLVPFARIETHRSSWTFSGTSAVYDGLTVDLDGTQYGYMVGEVEAVVYNDSEIPAVKERISSLVHQLAPENESVPVGKLEHYLIRHHPDHYEACVKGGSIQNRA